MTPGGHFWFSDGGGAQRADWLVELHIYIYMLYMGKIGQQLGGLRKQNNTSEKYILSVLIGIMKQNST